jgi:hypothetical protein
MLKKLAVAVVALTAVAGPASAADLLGCRNVGFVTDRDVITVSAAKPYSAIKLTVKGNAIEMLDLDVVYGNGNPDDLQVRSNIAAGGETRWIDLKGGKRAIRQIKMVYRSKPSLKGQATVCAYGR